MAQLRFTERAERDLMDIGNFIARDSPGLLPGVEIVRVLHGARDIRRALRNE